MSSFLSYNVTLGGRFVAVKGKGEKTRELVFPLYPIWGITRCNEPYSRYHHGVIAWGGVIAQAVVAVPIVVLGETLGYSRFQPLNTVLDMFGLFSLFVAAFDLIRASAARRVDAWGLVPVLFRRAVRATPKGVSRVGGLGDSVVRKTPSPRDTRRS